MRRLVGEGWVPLGGRNPGLKGETWATRLPDWTWATRILDGQVLGQEAVEEVFAGFAAD